MNWETEQLEHIAIQLRVSALKHQMQLDEACDVQNRQAAALERIATALERSAPVPLMETVHVDFLKPNQNP